MGFLRALGLGTTLLFFISGCSHTGQRLPASEPDTLSSALTNTRSYILAQRKDNRYWSGVFTSDASNDAVILALAKKIGKLTPELSESFLQSMAERMTADRQGWPAYPDGPADRNVTSVVVVCLKFVGADSDPRFVNASRWFENLGGEAKLPFFALQMVAPLGFTSKKLPPISPRIFGLPQFLPIQIEKMGFPRAFTVPFVTLSYLSKLRDQALVEHRKTIDQWRAEPLHIGSFKMGISKLGWAKQGLAWTIQNQNKGHGWCATIASLLGIRLLQEAERVGLGSFQEQTDQAWAAILRTRVLNQDNHLIQQPMAPGIWETASVLLAFENLKGTPSAFPEDDEKATLQWLLDRGTGVAGGRGWGFDETDKSNPDVDDTAHVVHALMSFTDPKDPVAESAIREGMAWISAHQNKDGGFPAWTREASRALAKVLHLAGKAPPFEDFSQSDITGRVLYTMAEARLRWPDREPDLRKPLQAACKYLAKKQPKMKGTSLALAPGHWMINYVYTAANVLAGLSTADCYRDTQDELARWMISTQQEDGGWGESEKGYSASTYIPDKTTVSQTAIALTGLILYYERLHNTAGTDSEWLAASIDKGVHFLIKKTDGGRSFAEKDFTGVLVKGLSYGRYEFLPAYTTFYVLGRWQKWRQ